MNKDKYKVVLSTETSSMVKKAIYKKYVIIGIILVTLLATTLIIVTRNNNYNEALEKLETKEYEKAYEILNNLGGTKATNKIKESKYSRSKEYLKHEDSVSAIILLNEINGYEDSEKLIDEIIRENSYLEVFISDINEEVILGEYEQDNNLENGKEPIDWIIIDKSDEKITLISKYVLDVKKFGYEDKYDQLIYWLKSDFVEYSFNNELLSILNDVKLLSNYDVLKAIDNGFSTSYLKSSLTKYALSKEIYKIYTNEGVYTWWLSDKYKYNDTKQFYTNTDTPYYVNTGLNRGSCSRAIMNGVRPVIVVSKNGDYEIKDYNLNFEKLGEVETSIPTKSTSNSYSSSSRYNSYNGYSYEERKEQCSKHWGRSWRCEIQRRYNCTAIGYSNYSDC